ncbi:MAG: PAS domain-containing protein [Verrucomicrobiota bacterium]|jgi:sigma-B regulation protein RsbU (phosphoserine phosphatase)
MSNASFGVLLIGDQPECLRLLRQEQFEVVCADRLTNGLAQLKTSPIGLVLVALSLPDTQGTEAFVKVHEAVPHLPIIVLATRAEEKLAASLMPLGAQDYLFVPELTGPMLARAIHNANERHLIREEHSRAGHLLELLMDNIPDSIYFKDKASQYVMINRALAKRFGLADSHLAVGKSNADFFTSDYAKQALADEQRVMQTGQPLVGVEEKETWPDGRVTWVSTTKMTLRDRAGRVFGTFGISRDITEHRRMEQVLAERSAELLKERLLLRTLIDNLPDAIYAKDTAGRKTLSNLTDVKNLHFKTEAETLGKTDFDLFPRELAERLYAIDQKVLQGEPLINQEESFVDETGRKRWLLTSKLPLRDQNGKITGLVGINREITLRKQAEIKLAYEQELFQKLLDNLPDAIYFKDRESRFVRVSRSKVEKSLMAVRNRYLAAHPSADPKELPPHLAGAGPFAEYMLGKTDFDFYAEERARPAYEDEQAIIRTGQPIIGKLERGVQPDGKVNWIISTKMPWHDKDGNIIGTFGVSRDVTDLKEAEDKLAFERELLHTMLESSPDRIYFKDKLSRFLKLSRTLVKRLGLENPEQAIGKTDFDFQPPERAKEFFEDEQRIIRSGESLINKIEKQIMSDGKVTWTSTSKVPLRDEQEQIVGIVGINRDITAHKLAEDKLAYEQELFQTLLDNLPDAIYFKDRQSRFMRLSRSKVEKTLATVRQGYLAGHPSAVPKALPPHLAGAGPFAEYMVGKTDFDFYAEERARPAYEDEQAIIRTGQPSIGKLERGVQPNGKVNWIITTKMPWRDKDGNIIGTFGVSRDITALKEAEEKLAEYTQQLEQKNKQTVEELKMARELQLAMLPHEFPCVPRHKPREESDLEFFSFFFPSGAVSGDFFDVVPLSDTAVGLFICDVMGHDVRAALVTAMMRALVVDLSTTTTEPGELLTQINREVAGVFQQTGSTMYATAFYLIADVARAELRYASAAHPEPILLHRQRGMAEWLGNAPGQKKGPALGLFAEGQFPTHRCPMEVGDLIALFTDGLIEAEGANNESFSAKRLLAAVNQRAKLPTNELFTGLLDEIKHFSATSEFEDDVCVVGVEVKRLETQQPNWMV